MKIRDKLFTAGTVVLTTGLVSLEDAVARKDASFDYEISNNAMASNLWYTQNMTQRYAGAFDDNKDGDTDRILVRDFYPLAHGFEISFREIMPENSEFWDLLGKINEKRESH